MRLRRLDVRIRTRIALWIAAIAIGLLVLMAAAVYVTFDRQLNASLDQTIALQAGANRQFIDDTRDPPTLSLSSDPGGERLEGEAVLRLYAADGQLLADGSPAVAITSDEQAAAQTAAETGRDISRTIELGDDHFYRLLFSPVPVAGAADVVLVTGLNRSRVTEPLGILRLILFIAVPVTAAGAGLGGYWISRRALKPVDAMSATAVKITHGDLHERVPGAEAGDELGRLAATLNAMIERLNETVERERRFTADASHELRTPLAAIETGIDVTLAHERPAAEYRRVLGVVRGQAGRLNLLANQLLLLSRLDSNQLQRTFTSLELGGLLEAVVESFEMRIQRSRSSCRSPRLRSMSSAIFSFSPAW